MKKEVIKVLAAPREKEIIKEKADKSNLSVSTFMKMCALDDNRISKTFIVRELSLLSNDIYKLVDSYDIANDDVISIDGRIKTICQNL